MFSSEFMAQEDSCSHPKGCSKNMGSGGLEPPSAGSSEETLEPAILPLNYEP